MNIKKIWLSPSGISALESCPLCFWLRYHKGIYQPEGFASRLPSRFDTIIKDYFDYFRDNDKLPPIIEKDFGGKLQKPFKETYFHSINEKFGLMGKLDECLITKDGKYIPFDHKTTSTNPKEKEIHPAYFFQLNFYAYLMKKNRLAVDNFGYLLFFYPQKMIENNNFKFEIILKKVALNPNLVEEKITEAIKVLSNPKPEANDNCAFCQWRKKIKNEEEENKDQKQNFNKDIIIKQPNLF